jgi:hypothetical protein
MFLLGIQHKNIGLILAPAAAGDAEIAKRRFSFVADQFCCVFHQLNEFASLLVLGELIGHFKILLMEG